MYAVILAGGKGKRFWPVSRESRPKQFVDITGRGSMISLTFERLAAFIPPERILLLTLKDQLAFVQKALPDVPAKNIYAEPVGRNTAPSLAVAASIVRSMGGDEPFLCCPADHLIRNADTFRRIVETAEKVARERDVLITFGIHPSRPATGYGYIEAGPAVEARNGYDVCEVRRFHEKPHEDQAKAYLERGGFYWNSGIFLWRPSVFISAFCTHLPEGAEPLASISDSYAAGDTSSALESEYHKMPSISVDYGVLEKARNVVVVPSDLDWDDVGSWDALFGILPGDEAGNVGRGDIVTIDSRGNLFFNPAGVTAAVGVDDTIVVVDGGTVLVCKRGQSQRVKELIESLERRGVSDIL